LTNNEIADKLFISNRTVDNHRANLLEKTDTKNTAELVAFVIVNKLIEIRR
jgi:two-component system response regulator NreC